MISTAELASVPVFASLGPAELELLARAAADIQVAAGEYAVNEGDLRALYVVLAGRVEVTKVIEGMERVIGTRLPGQIFGEVPLALGTPFPGSYRAAEPSRVMRVDARTYHTVAAVAPEMSAALGKLARERIGGLQGLAAQAPKAQVTMIGHRWDAACHDLRRFLARNQIVFDWLTPEEAAKAGPVPPADGCPLLRLPDGTELLRPPPRELALRLGLQTTPRHQHYDTIIIGGGPSGLAAAVYGASEGLRTMVIEREAPGGQAGTSSRIENYLGFPTGVSGDELASRALQQARRLGAEIVVTRCITALDPQARTVTLDGGDRLQARTFIIATGVTWRRLAIEGFDRLIGKGIYYGASRSEAGLTQGLDVYLIGAGNSAGQAALFFSSHAREVTLVVRGDSLEKSMSHYLVEQVRGKSNIRTALHSEVVAVHGGEHLAAIELQDRRTGTRERRECGGLFVLIGADAETGWLPEAIARDPRGYVLTGTDLAPGGRWRERRDPYLLETSVPGIFACGDVRYGPVKRVAAAVGEGSMAIAFVHQYLQQLRVGDGLRP